MSVLGCSVQHVGNPCLVAKGRIRRNPHVVCNGIGGDEANATDVDGELVWVLRDDIDGMATILLEDLHGIVTVVFILTFSLNSFLLLSLL